MRARVAELEAKGGQVVGYYVPLLHMRGVQSLGLLTGWRCARRYQFQAADRGYTPNDRERDA